MNTHGKVGLHVLVRLQQPHSKGDGLFVTTAGTYHPYKNEAPGLAWRKTWHTDVAQSRGHGGSTPQRLLCHHCVLITTPPPPPSLYMLQQQLQHSPYVGDQSTVGGKSVTTALLADVPHADLPNQTAPIESRERHEMHICI